MNKEIQIFVKHQHNFLSIILHFFKVIHLNPCVTLVKIVVAPKKY